MSKCTDCNEYNQEKHYCPKWCNVIRDTAEGLQEFYKDEHDKLERIEQIVKDHDNDSMPEDYWYIGRIREVLEEK